MEFCEIKYLPKESQVYLGSPSILRLRSGALLATHDYFGPRLVGRDGFPALTSVYRSEDNGVSWSNITHLWGAFWGTLFEVEGALYHLAISREYGDVVIRRSTDDGFTWSNPTGENDGILLRGGAGDSAPNYHFGGATNLFVHRGRICKALEDLRPLPEGTLWRPDRFAASVISAPVGSDLLRAASWTRSNALLMEPEKFPAECGYWPHAGWLEGTLAEAPDGALKMFMRVHLGEFFNKMAVIDVADDGSQIAFSHQDGIRDFIGGHSKFTIRRDPVSGRYYTVTNEYGAGEFPTLRNTLFLACSDDLLHWRKLKMLLWDDTGLDAEASQKLTGFQYPDWQFDGEDLIYLVRTAYRGAHNFHDSNRITYHVEKNFRRLSDSNDEVNSNFPSHRSDLR